MSSYVQFCVQLLCQDMDQMQTHGRRFVHSQLRRQANAVIPDRELRHCLGGRSIICRRSIGVLERNLDRSGTLSGKRVLNVLLTSSLTTSPRGIALPMSISNFSARTAMASRF